MKHFDHSNIPNDEITKHTCNCGRTVRICDDCPNEDNLTKCWEACKKCPVCFDNWLDPTQ